MKASHPAAYRRVVNEFEHTHADGTVEKHDAGKSLYVVDQVTIDAPGQWAAQVNATLPSGKTMSAAAAFDVKERTATPAVGEPVPSTRNLTARDVTDLAGIDSSTPPRPEMHKMSVAEALERQRPFVVVFATPSFCTSRLCGPVTEEAASLHAKYGDRVEFIHIEPWDLPMIRNEGKLVATDITKEWRLPTEPWTFVIGKDNRITARWESLVTPEELRAALDAALQ